MQCQSQGKKQAMHVYVILELLNIVGRKDILTDVGAGEPRWHIRIPRSKSPPIKIPPTSPDQPETGTIL